MAAAADRPPPLFVSLPGCLAQVVGVFALPFVVATPFAFVFDTVEVVETLPAMLGFSAVVLLPILVVHVVALILKSRRELLWWRERRGLTLGRAVDVLSRHARVATGRGWVLLVGGVAMTVLALVQHWASLGLIAVFALLLFYVLVGWTLFVSTFLARTFEVGMGRGDRGITRRMIPAVTVVGDPVEEVVTFRRVPVPWGYRMIVEDPNPTRLRTESRYAVGVVAGAGEVECTGRLRATPRGLYHLGPARISYQDVIGITQVSVASVATAELKVLPRVLPVVIVEPPRSPMVAPDVVTRPHRFATEDHFRFREYRSGDDTRRIHWRLSMRAGQLQLRLPEAKETSTEQILLVLDTFLPAGKLLDAALGGEEILDVLVLAWIGIARELVERGNKVTLASAAPGEDGGVGVEQVPARPGTVPRWQDLGARVRWQSEHDLGSLLDAIGPDAHGVVVTARFTAPPPGPFPGKSTTWLTLDPGDALGAPDPHWTRQMVGPGRLAWLRWVLFLPHPAGSEDNHLWNRLRDLFGIYRLYTARRTLRDVARLRAGRTFAELARRGDAVYRIERTPTAIRLVGLAGRKPAAGRAA